MLSLIHISANLPGRLVPIDLGHLAIHQDQVIPPAFPRRHRFPTVIHDVDSVAELFEGADRHLLVHGIVLRHQNPPLLASTLRQELLLVNNRLRPSVPVIEERDMIGRMVIDREYRLLLQHLRQPAPSLCRPREHALSLIHILTPTLLRLAPLPIRRIVGTLTDTQRVLETLGLATNVL